MSSLGQWASRGRGTWRDKLSVGRVDHLGTGAYGINSASQIVGKYFAADGSTHGFLAEPAKKGKPQ